MDFYSLFETSIRPEMERLARRTSDRKRALDEELAVTGNSRSGAALMRHARLRAEALTERGETVWGILKQVLEAVDPPYTGNFAAELRRRAAAFFPTDLSQEYRPLEEHAQRLSFIPVLAGMKHEVDVANGQARQTLMGRVELELARRQRLTERAPAEEATRPVIQISHSHGIQIGDGNIQSILASLETLVRGIDGADAAPEQKAGAKEKLKDFLVHPLTATVLGAAVGKLIGIL